VNEPVANVRDNEPRLLPFIYTPFDAAEECISIIIGIFWAFDGNDVRAIHEAAVSISRSPYDHIPILSDDRLAPIHAE
jgi:hypothetical protein